MEFATQCEEERAPLMAVMEEQRSAKERQQRSQPMVVE